MGLCWVTLNWVVWSRGALLLWCRLMALNRGVGVLVFIEMVSIFSWLGNSECWVDWCHDGRSLKCVELVRNFVLRLVKVAGHLREVAQEIGNCLEAHSLSFGSLWRLRHHVDFLLGSNVWLLLTEDWVCWIKTFILRFAGQRSSLISWYHEFVSSLRNISSWTVRF